jgi:hypothetical protein
MLTDINATRLARLYKIDESTLGNHLRPHREKLDELATKYFISKTNRWAKRQCYNSDQLKFIIETIFSTHTPLGYTFNGSTLIPVTDFK